MTRGQQLALASAFMGAYHLIQDHPKLAVSDEMRRRLDQGHAIATVTLNLRRQPRVTPRAT